MNYPLLSDYIEAIKAAEDNSTSLVALFFLQIYN